MAATKIEWADETINVVAGCEKCSEGCFNCYAAPMAWRLANNPKVPEATRQAYAQAVYHTDSGNYWSGLVVEIPGWERQFERLAKVKKPKRVFAESMGDLFHDGVRVGILRRVMEQVADMPQHVFMFLTKRPLRMRELFLHWEQMYTGNAILGNEYQFPLPNLWLGVTVCNQDEADKKIPLLLETPAAKRFISVEPMIGPISLEPWLFGGYGTPYDIEVSVFGPTLDWVIAGGETGHRARPMNPDWPRDLLGQCRAAGVPFFFKSWGDFFRARGEAPGRMLDGREWNEVPK